MPLPPSPVPLKLGSRAERFHILKNLGEALEGLLARHLASKRQKNIQETLEEPIPIEQSTRSLRRSRHPWSVGNSPIERNAWPVFLRRPEQLTPEEQADLLTLRQSHPEVNQTSDLVQQFAQMLRTRTGEQLDTWLAKGAESQLPELQSFLLGIERDKSAVAAGLTLPQSYATPIMLRLCG